MDAPASKHSLWELRADGRQTRISEAFRGVDKMDNTKLKRQMKKFEEYLIFTRGLSKVTIGGYSRSLSIALRRMKKFIPRHDDVKAYILWMHEKEYSYNHIVNTSLAIEHYSIFKGNPIKIGRPKKPRRILQNMLSEAEVSRMIQSAKDIRERALTCLLAYSGIRNQEICNLKVEDVDFGSNRLKVLSGKNSKDRVVNISCECTKVLVEYLQAFPRKVGEYFFSTLAKGNRLATGDVRKTIRVLAQRAQIGRRVFPHLFRHSLATNLLNRGASLTMIQAQLGHAWLTSTLIYAVSLAFRNQSEYHHFLPAYM